MFTDIQIPSLFSTLGSIIASIGISLILFTFLLKQDNVLWEEIEKMKVKIDSLEKKWKFYILFARKVDKKASNS